MKEKSMVDKDLAEAVKELFKEQTGAFRAADFVAVADVLGFCVYRKPMPEEQLKAVAEHHFPDIIGTNLQYAVEAYEWKTHMPMTEEGKIVSGFWDCRSRDEWPEGYEIEAGGRFLSRVR